MPGGRLLVALAVAGALYVTSNVVVPLTFSLMIYFLLRPLVRRLRRFGVPKAAAAALVLTATLGTVGVVALELATPAANWAQRLPTAARQLEAKSRALRRPVERASRIADTVEKVTDIGSSAGTPVVTVAKPSFFDSLLEGALGLAAQCFVAVAAAYFLLLRGNTLLGRMLQFLPDIHNRSRAAAVIDQVEHDMSRYLITVTIINLALGASVGAVMYWTDMPNPWLWGGVACVLNYVPYLGSAVGVAVVGLASFVTFAEWREACLPPLLYFVLTALEGNFVTPLILGRTFRISPLVVFVWLVFWAWLWGVPGAMLAVPLLMLLKIVSEQSSAFAPVAKLIED